MSDSATRPRRAGAGPRQTPDEAIAGLAPRQVAARLLGAVVDARTPLDALTDAEHGHPQFRALSARDRALVRAILATALRHRVTIGRLIARRLDRPLPQNARSLEHILHVAAAQMLFLDVPDRAAVDMAVAHAKSDPRTVRFAGLVNAVLRALGRVKERALPAELKANDDAPDWFSTRLKAAYGAERAAAILAAHRAEPPIDFTVKSDPEGWADRFGGIVLPTGSVRVARLSCPVQDLPGYAEGEWWVQDAAAALPARLLGDVRGLSVADLCAAPGGKTAQLAAAGARVTAVDLSRSRLKRLSANLDRLKLSADVVEADLLAWDPPALFDAILLDAPCSSTGTVRRHPDVPWTKGPEDIARLAGLQKRLLERAVAMVRPGGLVVFSNCSLDPEEGEDLAVAFLAVEPRVRADPIRADELPGIAAFVTAEGTLRTSPADLAQGTASLSGLDGFFAARFRRLAP